MSVIENFRQWVQQGRFDDFIREVAEDIAEIKLENEVIDRERIVELLRCMIPPMAHGIMRGEEDEQGLQTSVADFVRKLLTERRVELIELISTYHDLEHMDIHEQYKQVRRHIENAFWQSDGES